MRTALITSALGGLVGAVVSLGLYLTRNVLSQRVVSASDFPRRYTDYLRVPSDSVRGYSWWPVVGVCAGFGLAAGLLLGLVAASAGLRVTRAGTVGP